MRFPDLARRSFGLGHTPWAPTGYIKRFQPHCYPQQGDPGMLFSRKTTSVHSSLVGQLRTGSGYVGRGGREGCRCKSKDQPATTFQDKRDWFQVPEKIWVVDQKRYRLSIKKDKDDANRKYWDEAPKDKAKSHNPFSANQPQTQASKKRQESR